MKYELSYNLLSILSNSQLKSQKTYGQQGENQQGRKDSLYKCVYQICRIYLNYCIFSITSWGFFQYKDVAFIMGIIMLEGGTCIFIETRPAHHWYNRTYISYTQVPSRYHNHNNYILILSLESWNIDHSFIAFDRLISAFNIGTWSLVSIHRFINTLLVEQNSRHFADDIFKCIFV